MPELPHMARQRAAVVAASTWDARVAETLAIVAKRYQSLRKR